MTYKLFFHLQQMSSKPLSNKTSFDLQPYMDVYTHHIKLIKTNKYTTQNVYIIAVAIRTSTVVYKDLPLSVVKEFEASIKWNPNIPPFITHLNPTTKTIITAIKNQSVDLIAKDISTLANISKQFNYKYIITSFTTSTKLTQLCKQLQLELINLTDADIHKLCAQTKVRKIPEPKLELRPYQQEYLDFMNQNESAILKLPCGMGKTLIMVYHMMTHGERSVILVPNIALVGQFYDTIEYIYKAFKHPLPEIHGLSTVDKDYSINDPDNQQIIISVYNSFVNKFIKPQLHRNTKHTKNTRGTKHTRDVVEDLDEEEETNDLNDSDQYSSEYVDEDCITHFTDFPYIYIDEAHHVINPSNRKQASLIKSYMDDDDSELTAIDSYANLIYSYAQTHCTHSYYFSATISPASFSNYNIFKAITDNYLCRFNIDFLRHNEPKTQLKPDQRIDSLCKYLEASNYISIIIYASRVATAKSIAKRLKGSVVIESKIPALVRERHYRAFKEYRLRYLITVNCISEGVDLPNADCAVFFDEKHSIINIIQCIGRIVRTSKYKLSSTLLLPVYKGDIIENIHRSIVATVNEDLGYGNVNMKTKKKNKIDCEVRYEIHDA